MMFIVSVKTLNEKLKKIKAKLRKLRHSKKWDILKNVQKTKCLNKVTWLMTMKLWLKIKNRSHRYDINRPKHGHKYTKYQMFLNIMMLICINN